MPRSVREELNCRLLDGEPQNRLVEWLNGRPEVQDVLKAHYDGRPVNEPNMTAWAQGGFEDWRRQQEALEAAGRAVEESAVAEAMARQDQTGASTGGRSLVDRVSTMAAVAIAQEFMAVRRMEDGAEKRRAVLKLVRGLVRLRKSDRECERGQREAAQAERAAEVHDHWAEGARRRRKQAESAAKRGWWTEEDPPSPSLRRAGDDAINPEHECVDVRKKMAEIMARMSDAEIAETLRRSGYLRPPKAARTSSAEVASAEHEHDYEHEHERGQAEGGPAAA